jgi:hypothetical protein
MVEIGSSLGKILNKPKSLRIQKMFYKYRKGEGKRKLITSECLKKSYACL